MKMPVYDPRLLKYDDEDMGCLIEYISGHSHASSSFDHAFNSGPVAMRMRRHPKGNPGVCTPYHSSK